MIEIRKDIVGYEWLYKVSNYWRVQSYDRTNTRVTKNNVIVNRIIKWRELLQQCSKNNPYKQVHLSKEWKTKTFRIHRLVASIFISDIKSGQEVAHIDWNKTNNIVTNLLICTHKENMSHTIKHNTSTRWEKSTNTQLVEKEVIDIFTIAISNWYYKIKFWNSRSFGMILDKIQTVIHSNKIKRNSIKAILCWKSRKYIYKKYEKTIENQKAFT